MDGVAERAACRGLADGFYRGGVDAGVFRRLLARHFIGVGMTLFHDAAPGFSAIVLGAPDFRSDVVAWRRDEALKLCATARSTEFSGGEAGEHRRRIPAFERARQLFAEPCFFSAASSSEGSRAIAACAISEGAFRRAPGLPIHTPRRASASS